MRGTPQEISLEARAAGEKQQGRATSRREKRTDLPNLTQGQTGPRGAVSIPSLLFALTTLAPKTRSSAAWTVLGAALRRRA